MARPRLIKTPEELIEKFNNYLDACEAEQKPRTPTKRHFLVKSGYYKDLISEYAKNYEEEFSGALKYIDKCCEAYTEHDMINNEANYGAGKFSLMNNYGWKDKTEDNKGTTIIINDRSKEVTQC